MDPRKYFDHIYIITIARATDRHLRLHEVMNEWGAELFFGADAKDLDENELERQGLIDRQKAIENHRFNRPLTGGALGCSLSHRMVYQHMLTNGFNRVLVLEDDIKLVPDAAAHFEEIMQLVPDDWQLLFFDYMKNEEEPPYGGAKRALYHFQRKIGLLNLHSQVIENMYARPVNSCWNVAGYHDYASAYAIDRAAAKTLLDFQTPVQWLADNALAQVATRQLVKAYSARIRIFSQASQPGGTFKSLIAQ